MWQKGKKEDKLKKTKQKQKIYIKYNIIYIDEKGRISSPRYSFIRGIDSIKLKVE